MRLITVALLMLTATGCYSSHDDDSDAGPTDARVLGDADPDAPDGGASALASCDAPVSEWTPTQQRYSGEVSGLAARLRDGERTSIAAHTPDVGLTLIHFDEMQPVPALRAEISLVPRARPVAGAMDSVRVAITYLDASAQTHVAVFDPDGAPLSDTRLADGTPSATMAIRDARVGVAFVVGAPWVAVLDATGGPRFHETELLDAREVSLGLGRGLFAAVVTQARGESRYWGVDEAGTVDAGGIGARLLRTEWDGASVVGWDDTTNQIAVRVPGGRLAPLGVIERAEPALGPSLAMRGSEVWVAVSYDRRRVRFVHEDAELERTIDGSMSALMAHSSRRHRGAFVLDDDARQLMWIGWSCDPDR